MFRRLYFLIALLLFTTSTYSNLIDIEDRNVLESFFRLMIEESEAGYVLLNEKPICIHGFYLDEQHYFNDHHKSSVIIKEASFRYKKLFPNNSDNNIIIHFYDQPDSLVKNVKHVLFINKYLIEKVIKENLSLFQLVLGPSIQAENFVEHLTNPNETFHSFLKDNKTLIGILLGFGTKNSLMISRIEELQESLMGETLPYKARILKLDPQFKPLFLFGSYEKPKPLVRPSFGFENLEDEITTLMKQVTVSSSKLSQDKPEFIFGRLIKDEETDLLVIRLEKTQEKIKDLLRSKDFFSKTLSLLFPKENFSLVPNINPSNNLLNLSKNDLEKLPVILSYNIFNRLKNENTEFKENFVKAIKDINIKKIENIDYEKAKNLLEIAENLKETELFFKGIDSSSKTIIPNKLYYKIIKKGEDKTLKSFANVCLNYKLKTASTTYVNTWETGQKLTMHMNDMIPGLSFGLIGMNKGEIRHIYIHPELAYGIHTLFEKGAYLEMDVELVDFEEDINSPSCLDIANMRLDCSIDLSDINEKTLHRNAGYQAGFLWKTFYEKSKICDFPAIIQAYEKNEFLKEDSEVLQKLKWNIFQQPFYK